jgi:aarF domain-containing kinase
MWNRLLPLFSVSRRALLTTTLGGVGCGIMLRSVSAEETSEYPFPEHKQNHTIFSRLSLLAHATTRIARDTNCVLRCVFDYMMVSRKTFATLEEEEDAWSLVHQKCATRLKALCFKNGGLYIKFGQHVASLPYLLPMEYVNCMKVMLDETPQTHEDEVRRIFQQEFGHLPEELFSQFDYHPIASASLAQVHIAYTKEGQKVAVKVQHPGLAENAHTDTAIVKFFATQIHRFFPEFDYQWLASEIAYNLPRELDFLLEGANAEKCRVTLMGCNVNVHIPHIYWEISSKKILTMEFIDGCKINDVKAIQDLGFRPRDVSTALCHVFDHQIFISGFVHCDPHPANVFIRRNNNQMQLILLDHGLYTSLPTSFRLQYCALWKAIVTADVEMIRVESERLNAGSLYPLFASILTAAPWKQLSVSQFDTRAKPVEFAHIKGE